MRLVGKLLAIGGLGGGLAAAAYAWRTLGARRTQPGTDARVGDVSTDDIDNVVIDDASPDVHVVDPDPKNTRPYGTGEAMFKSAGGAGAMSVGAVDEVELGAGIARPMRGDVEPESFDPEEVPSEHPEINELRNKMPFG